MNVEQAKTILKKKGLSLENLAINNLAFEKACNVVYKSIPIPIRWFVGKKQIHNMIQKVRDQITAANYNG